MKVVRPSLNILLDMLKDLEKKEQILRDYAKSWSTYQGYRDNGWGVDGDLVADNRRKLEAAIVEYRKQLAEVYDYMGDRGLY